jgi:hypothetical protein
MAYDTIFVCSVLLLQEMRLLVGYVIGEKVSPCWRKSEKRNLVVNNRV